MKTLQSLFSYQCANLKGRKYVRNGKEIHDEQESSKIMDIFDETFNKYISAERPLPVIKRIKDLFLMHGTLENKDEAGRGMTFLMLCQGGKRKDFVRQVYHDLNMFNLILDKQSEKLLKNPLYNGFENCRYFVEQQLKKPSTIVAMLAFGAVLTAIGFMNLSHQCSSQEEKETIDSIKNINHNEGTTAIPSNR